jgi:hypothetical protein
VNHSSRWALFSAAINGPNQGRPPKGLPPCLKKAFELPPQIALLHTPHIQYKLGFELKASACYTGAIPLEPPGLFAFVIFQKVSRRLSSFAQANLGFGPLIYLSWVLR